MLGRYSIGVVVPAHNEEQHIATVITSIPEYVDVIVVVDDRSSDLTAEIATSSPSSSDVIVIKSLNHGVGGAIDTGHQYLLENLSQPFVSAVMAGDGQMDPSDLEGVLIPIIEGRADYVKGNRRMHRDGYNTMPSYRKFASSILSGATTLASGKVVSDPQCGYCAVSSNVLLEWDFSTSWSGYGYPNFWLIRLSCLGFIVREVPVKSVYNGSTSGIRPLKFFLSVGFMMFREHHRRNLAWLIGKNRTPHTLFALFAYIFGWLLFLPIEDSNFKDVLIESGAPAWLLGVFFWVIAHVFDRLSAGTHERMRINGSRRS